MAEPNWQDTIDLIEGRREAKKPREKDIMEILDEIVNTRVGPGIPSAMDIMSLFDYRDTVPGMQRGAEKMFKPEAWQDVPSGMAEYFASLLDVIPMEKAAGAAGKAMFIGPAAVAGARDFNKSRALGKAKLMKEQGASNEEIWDATGWFQNVDQKWRFEISDDAAKTNPTFLTPTEMQEGYNQFKPVNVGKVGDFFEHPEFYQYYPGAADYPLEVLNPKYGSYGYMTDKAMGVAANPSHEWGGHTVMDFIDDVFVHEGTHGIQRAEGFAAGGNPEMFTKPGQHLQRVLADLSLRRYDRSKTLMDTQAKVNRLFNELKDTGIPDVRERDNLDSMINLLDGLQAILPEGKTLKDPDVLNKFHEKFRARGNAPQWMKDAYVTWILRRYPSIDDLKKAKESLPNIKISSVEDMLNRDRPTRELLSISKYLDDQLGDNIGRSLIYGSQNPIEEWAKGEKTIFPDKMRLLNDFLRYMAVKSAPDTMTGYRQLAGEAEARLAQNTMRMTPGERANSFPLSRKENDTPEWLQRVFYHLLSTRD